jgi:amino acid permease
MKNACDKKMKKVSLCGICICSFFYILVGIMGYCLFGNNINSNFLLAFHEGTIN